MKEEEVNHRQAAFPCVDTMKTERWTKRERDEGGAVQIWVRSLRCGCCGQHLTQSAVANTSHSLLWPTPHTVCCGQHLTQSAVANTSHRLLWPTPHTVCCGQHLTQSAVANTSHSLLWPAPHTVCCGQHLTQSAVANTSHSGEL